MKSLSIYVIGTKHLWPRLVKLIESPALQGYNVKIISLEDEKAFSEYHFNQEKIEKWNCNIKLIKKSLIDNIARIQNIESSSIKDQVYKFMEPRMLNKGEISVLKKHEQALRSFILDTTDYALVLEDDAILDQDAIEKVLRLIQDSSCEYYDLGGGDNLECRSEIVRICGIDGEINEYCSTRTACAYAVSIDMAHIIVDEIRDLVMPIDWSISVALNRVKPKPQVFWCKDLFIKHGSCTGAYKSWRNE